MNTNNNATTYSIFKVHFDVKGFCCGDIVMFIISIVYNFTLSHHLISSNPASTLLHMILSCAQCRCYMGGRCSK